MRSLFAIFVFLIMPITAQAAPDSHAQNADKIMAVLEVLDLNSPAMQDAAYYIDQKTVGKYFYLANEEMAGMQVQLRYNISGLHTENLQVNITEAGANYNVTGSTEGAMLHYKIEF